MSDMENENGAGRVNDRRRVDANGDSINPPDGDRPVAAEEDSARSAAAAEGGGLELNLMQGELEAARRRIDELARAVQALTQDREDFKLRLTRERERMLDVERGNVARLLLEAIDDLDRCLVASTQDGSALAQGVRMIRDGLLSKLQSTGIERLNLVGQRFDPNLAEAADMEMTAAIEDDQKVLSEITAGYRLKDRIIRPARVKVARYVQPAQA